MSAAPRSTRSLATPVADSTKDRARAKVLRPSDRPRAPESRRIDARTEAALAAFEEVAASFEPWTEPTALRRAAAAAMRELVREHGEGTLPTELSDAIERWLDGEFSGTSADVEIANHAIVTLLGSEVVVDVNAAP